MKPPIAEIVESVALAFHVKASDITSGDRSAQFTRPRFMVYAIAHDAGYSYPSIGARLGGRDHTSVMSGVKRFRILCDTLPEYDSIAMAVRFSIAAKVRTETGKPITPAEAIRRLVAASERMQRDTQSIIAQLEAAQ